MDITIQQLPYSISLLILKAAIKIYMIALSDDTRTKFIGEIVFELNQQTGVIHFLLCISDHIYCLVSVETKQSSLPEDCIVDWFKYRNTKSIMKNIKLSVSRQSMPQPQI